MKRFLCYSNMIKGSANILIVLVLFISACSVLPPEFGQIFEDEINRQVEELGEEIEEEARAYGNEIIEDARQTITEKISGFIDQLFADRNVDAPEEIGLVSIGINPITSKQTIRTQFRLAYEEMGGEKVLGTAKDLVHYWEVRHPKYLIQELNGGEQEYSIIVMEDGTDYAYILMGKWLETYMAMGGPEYAGFPLSNPEKWNITPFWELWNDWGRGKRQLFEVEGESYAFLQIKGSEEIYLVPPRIWSTYKEVGVAKIGYPVSNYPIDDKRWNTQNLSQDTIKILYYWQKQAYRVQLFEHGSIIWRDDRNAVDIIEYSPLIQTFNLGESNLLLRVDSLLKIPVFDNELYGRECLADTLNQAAIMAGQASADALIPQVALMPLKAALSGTTMVTESIWGKIALKSSEILLNRAAGDSWKEASIPVVAGLVVDSVYSKAIGEVISAPASEVTTLVVGEEIDTLLQDRYSIDMTRKIGDGPNPVAEVNSKMSLDYDPYTNFVSGILVTDYPCYPEGIAFYFKSDHNGGLATRNEVWDGRLHLIDVETGNEIDY